MFERAVAGATEPGLADVEIVVRPALAAGASDVIDADGYLLGTPANLGYMSGALKHFFDVVYYPALEATQRRPWALLVHGNNDTSGAVDSVERVVTGLGWRAVARPVEVVGQPGGDDLDACWELGATLAATLSASA